MKLIYRLMLIFACFGVSCPVLANDQLRQSIENWSGGYPASLLNEPVMNKTPLSRFYIQNDFKPVWFSNARLTESGRVLISTIKQIDGDGLLPSDYHSEVLLPLLAAEVGAQDVAAFDLLLSDAFFSLAGHLQAGKIDPISLSDEWEANRRHGNVETVLQRVIKQGDVATALDSMRPKQIRYYRLKIALAKMKLLPNTSWQKPLAETPAIKTDNTDTRLPMISARLRVWGDLPSSGAEATEADTKLVYDAALQQGVKHFQTRHGLDPDGVIGRETIKALNISPKERAKQIIVNMERWRWLAEDLGDKHLLVNIAAFELKIIDHNETVFVKPVVVGRNYRKTPVFSNKIRYLVLNPTWTVPFKLAVEDKLAEIQKDPGYLNRLGIRVFRGDSTVPIDPFSIHWNEITKRNFPFRLVQGPGPQNALGQVKFMFPNPHDVYLHDTPSRELFKKAERAFSSGCIRVSDPLELAEFLLRDQGWDHDKIAAVIAKGNTETVSLKTPLPIHIEYWTAWVDREGGINFRNDIYERDQPLWQALNKPLIHVEH
ncbi:MAG: L,D-transpeptidase family protein [Zhongshania sp.]|uniref:L,D-transpeptidase family protein n=1 Tax=Zhongshania sp. TaxID=1971902 RepID=UPI002618A308|nr:L,D-transpeptidase family protein [Zhongshania sp.]MDF1693502.1 L,D-transpeptidase family protein [Zhongshania sp.]